MNLAETSLVVALAVIALVVVLGLILYVRQRDRGYDDRGRYHDDDPNN